jgi:hypothetical protein
MERYLKEHSSKWQSKYSEKFKRFVSNDLTPNQVHQNNLKSEKLWKNYYVKGLSL